jgi:hypothetical protein
MLIDSTPSANIYTKPNRSQEAVWPTYVKFLEDLSQHPGEPVLVYRITKELGSYRHDIGSHAEKQITMGVVKDDVQPAGDDPDKHFKPVVFADNSLVSSCNDEFFNTFDHVTSEPGGTIGLDVRHMSDSWNLREEIYTDIDGGNAKLIEEPCYQIVVGLENIADWANARGDHLRQVFFEMAIKLGLDPGLTPELKQMMLEKRAKLTQRFIETYTVNIGRITDALSGETIEETETTTKNLKHVKAELEKLGITELELGRIVLKTSGIDVDQLK